ncbi:hypothetical protein GCM10027343_15970 [Noviherbaspirillum agri]
MLHRSPYIWIAIAVSLVLAVAVSKEAATAFAGAYLIVDGMNIIRTKVVDIGDWQGSDSYYVLEGIPAQLFGGAGVVTGAWLFLRWGILDTGLFG